METYNVGEIEHHGIKGMHWGVRRTPAQLGHKTASSSSNSSKSSESNHEDYTKAHSGKSVKSMSDAELRSKLNRLQMEQQYSKLNPSTVSKGSDFVNKALKVGTTVATATTTALTIYNNFKKINDIVSKTTS